MNYTNEMWRRIKAVLPDTTLLIYGEELDSHFSAYPHGHEKINTLISDAIAFTAMLYLRRS